MEGALTVHCAIWGWLLNRRDSGWKACCAAMVLSLEVMKSCCSYQSLQRAGRFMVAESFTVIHRLRTDLKDTAYNPLLRIQSAHLRAGRAAPLLGLPGNLGDPCVWGLLQGPKGVGWCLTQLPQEVLGRG